jgi:hypothetical protein
VIYFAASGLMLISVIPARILFSRIPLSTHRGRHFYLIVMIASINVNACGFMHAIPVPILLASVPGLAAIVYVPMVNIRDRTSTVHGQAAFLVKC